MRAIFIDTNIVLDMVSNRKPFAEASIKLFVLAKKNVIKLYISSVSYNIIYYILRKKHSHLEVILILKHTEILVETIDVTKPVIFNSLNSTFIDFEDAIQYYSAISVKKIEAIVTRNGKDFKASQLPVLSPKEALSIIGSKNN